MLFVPQSIHSILAALQLDCPAAGPLARDRSVASLIPISWVLPKSIALPSCLSTSQGYALSLSALLYPCDLEQANKLAILFYAI